MCGIAELVPSFLDFFLELISKEHGAALKVDPMERTFCNHRSSGHMGQPMAEEEDNSLL